MKVFFGVVALVIVALGLFIGTVGGIHDNIQFRDWFSVSMWAIFGPVGFSLALAGAGSLLTASSDRPDTQLLTTARLSRISGWAAIIWLAVVAIGLLTGTIGGIHDNIGFQDWHSVTMWAVFGPAGCVLSGVGAVLLAKKLMNSAAEEQSEVLLSRTSSQQRYYGVRSSMN